jgi:tetratricopeptide (TPR) repeat protein
MELTGELRVRPPAQQPLCLLAHLHRYLRIFDGTQGAIAMEYARRAVRAGDRPADAYLTLGVVHEKRGEHAEATLAIRQALDADPRHADALRWLGLQANAVGDVLLEYQFTKAAYEAAPNDPFYLRDLEYVMLARLDDPQGMAAMMEAALARDARNADVHARLGHAAARLGDEARAQRHRERAAELRAIARGGAIP